MAAPSEDIHPSDPTMKQQRNREGVSMIEMVVGELGLIDLFDAAALKATRLTCRALRDLVDATGTFSSSKFTVYDFSSREGLNAWTANPGWIQRTRSLAIKGRVRPALAGRVITAIATNKPPISKLKLDGVERAGNKLLTAPLQQLRDLHLENMWNSNHYMNGMDGSASLDGLRSLHLEGCSFDAATLAAALARFSALQSLKLYEINAEGNAAASEILRNALSNLVMLEIWDSSGVDELGLLGPQSPALPALRHLFLSNDNATMVERPWLQQLTYLELDENHVDSPEVVAALNGGPLEILKFSTTIIDEVNDWQWDDLEFPHLTYIRLWTSGYPDMSGDILAYATRARMPVLRKANLGLNECTSVAGVRTFIAAFPNLRGLCLSGSIQSAEEGVLELFFSHVVPNLESLAFQFAYRGIESISEIIRRFLPAARAGAAPLWPNLRSLELWLPYTITDRFIERFKFFPALIRAASRLPALTSLRIKARFDSADYTQEAMAAFVAAAEKAGASNLVEALRWDAAEDW